MNRLPTLLMTILAAGVGGETGRGKMYVVVRRPYAHLREQLRQAFAGQDDVNVVVDRRYGERRTRFEPVTVDRRRGDQRSPATEIVEVRISATS